MNKRKLFFFLALLGVCSITKAQLSDNEIFTQTTSKLDANGTYYEYINSRSAKDKIIIPLFDSIGGVIVEKAKGDKDPNMAANVKETIRYTKALFDALDLNQIQGVGFSSKPFSAFEGKELFQNKSYLFLNRPVDSGIFSVLGQKSYNISFLSQLPKETIAAMVVELTPDKLTKSLADQKLLPYAYEQPLDMGPDSKTLKKLSENLSGTFELVILSLATKKGEPFDPAQLRYYMAIPDNNSLIFDSLAELVASLKDPSITFKDNVITFSKNNLYATMLKNGGSINLYVGTDTKMMIENAAKDAKLSLASQPRFQAISKNIPTQANVYCYADGAIIDTLVSTISDLEAMDVIQKIIEPLDLTALSAVKYEDKGIYIVNNSFYDFSSSAIGGQIISIMMMSKMTETLMQGAIPYELLQPEQDDMDEFDVITEESEPAGGDVTDEIIEEDIEFEK